MEGLEIHLEYENMLPLIVRGSFFEGVPDDDDGCGEIGDVPGDKQEPGSLDDRGAEAAKADNGDEAGDPETKKLMRKLRNRDAAVRSRERKKMYVKDLEVKSKYLEGECRRLGRFAQCVMAENQALHFRLQNCACGANVAKQEPAVPSGVKSLDSGLLWIDEIESIRMRDNEEDGGGVGGSGDGVRTESSQDFCDRFISDVLVDSPGDGCGEIVDVSGDKEEPGSLDDGGAEAEKADEADNGDEAGDPVTKELRRKLRNMDASVRSRERKKMYVKDLEVKSKYLEGECRRLGRLRQCVMAENQALRFSLQNSACGADVANQESAMLSQPLPLGSLFWFLCITCLFTLPMPLLLALEAVLWENAGKGNPRPLAARGARSEMFGSCGVQTLDKSRKYKASRTKMKAGFLLSRVLA